MSCKATGCFPAVSANKGSCQITSSGIEDPSKHREGECEDCAKEQNRVVATLGNTDPAAGVLERKSKGETVIMTSRAAYRP